MGSSESLSIGGVLFRPTAVQNFLKDSPTEIDVNEGETCSCDEETTLEFLFSFLLREIIFSSDLEPHRKSRIDQVFELLQANHLSPFDLDVTSS